MSAQLLDARQIFLEAVENHAPEQWAEFLDSACQGDADLRARVEALLKAHGQYADCLDGECVYTCLEGAIRCNGSCTFLNSDPNNCGACGNLCPATAPYCIDGACSDVACAAGTTWCDFYCADLFSDPYNCGACFNQCAPSEFCSGGICQGVFGEYVRGVSRLAFFN